MPRGGRREGAGRKRRTQSAPNKNASGNNSSPPAPQKQYANAEEYLEAVVMGLELPDRDRIAAAKAMLPYQIAKRRLPVKTDAPRQMELSTELEQEKQQREEWEKTQKAVTLSLVRGGLK